MLVDFVSLFATLSETGAVVPDEESFDSAIRVLVAASAGGASIAVKLAPALAASPPPPSVAPASPTP